MVRGSASPRVARRVLALAFSSVPVVIPASAQPSPIQYAYDERGQLIAVVDQDGNAAIYVYDAVGNILSIQRVDAAAIPERVAITAVVPDKGKTGTLVSILGKGFGPAVGQNTVAFNGAVASVTQASATRVTAIVPAGATTGLVTVASPLGSAISPRPFRVVGALTVTPATANLGPGRTQQFIATESGAEVSNVFWTVDGVVGGDPSVGSITGQGLYTAPTTVAALRTVTVTATSKDDVSVIATAMVRLQPPVPAYLAAAPVGVQVVDTAPGVVVAPAIGVQRAPDGAGLTVVAAAVGVSPPTAVGFSGNSHVSVALEPLITSTAPAAGARGAANLVLTMTGSGLGGAMALEFLLNNIPDTAIGVANLTATADGTQATAAISISATAPLGPRVIRLRTPSGTTTSVGAGGNVFTVQ